MVVAQQILLKRLGRAAYLTVLEAMRAFTARRDAATPDELWLVEHPPVYTLGLAADPAHGPRLAGDIPLVQVERGGEITYHGPGQVVLYTLVDLARRGIKVREFVRLLERSVLDLLGGRGELRRGPPGSTWTVPRSLHSAFASGAAAPSTACRSTSTWIWRPSPRSTPAAFRGCG